MASASQSSIRFSEHEQEEMSDYRPLNRSALASLLLGVFSGLAPFHPAFCVIPLLGIMAAFFSLRQFGGSTDNRQSGRSLAILGLALSLLFCSWAVARQTSRQQHLSAQAKNFADHWLKLIQEGKLYEVHQLTLTEGNRVAPGTSLETYYLPDKNSNAAPGGNGSPPEMPMDLAPPPNQQFDGYFSGAAAKLVRDMGSSLNPQFQQVLEVRSTGNNTLTVVLEYSLSGAVDAHPQTLRASITLERAKDAETADWRVSDFQRLEGG